MQTWETNSEEAANKRKAAIITIVVNLLLLLAIYFIVVWREQIPPLPKYGMELNLGFTDVGSGNIQRTAPPSEVQSSQTEAPSPGDPAPQPTEAVVPVTQPKTEAAKSTSKTAQPSVEAVSKTPSPIKASDKPRESKPDPKPEKREEKPVTQPSNATEKTTTTPVEEKPKIDQRAIFGAGGTSGTSNQPAAGSSQGSSTQKGDEGKPTGTVDGRAIMGSGTGQGVPGPASGYNLDMAGWDFASKPNISDKVSDRNGRIVFDITVDSNGKLVRAIPREYNVSNEVLAYYRTVVNQISFRRTGGEAAADFSTGKITFIIKVD